MRVKYYLTRLLKLCNKKCARQVVLDKADKTLQQKYACQVVPDKADKTLQ